MKIIFSNSATQHGYGKARFKWVSNATATERLHARNGGIVLFNNGRLSGGKYGTPYRMILFRKGRYLPRVPSQEIIAAYEKGL